MSEILAKRLREVRENRRKTQQDMAKMLGISSVGYGGWERGDAEPSISNLVKLCQFFDVSADWLIGLDKAKPEQKPLIVERISILKSEADQAAATLSRLLSQIGDMEKSI